MRAIAAPRPEQKVIQPYTEGDVQAMLRAIGRSRSYKRPRDCRRISHAVDASLATRNKAVILLLLDTGMRASELSGLRTADVDLRNIERISFLAGMATMTWRRWSGS